jgi:hypothetical protein
MFIVSRIFGETQKIEISKKKRIFFYFLGFFGFFFNLKKKSTKILNSKNIVYWIMSS